MICKYFREDLMVPRGDNPKKKMGKGIYIQFKGLFT